MNSKCINLDYISDVLQMVIRSWRSYKYKLLIDELNPRVILLTWINVNPSMDT